MPFVDPWQPVSPTSNRRDAAVVRTYRYVPAVPDTGGSDPETDPLVEGSPAIWTLLPNVQAVSVRRDEGPDASVCVLRYDFSYATIDEDAPATPEEAINTTFVSPLVIEVNDRIVVAATRPDAVTEFLFDGHALRWEFALDGQREEVRVTALGVERLCRQDPIGGPLVRPADDPEDGDNQETDLVARFNPHGIGNASPEDHDSGEAGPPDEQYPVFVDPAGIAAGSVARRWTLAMAARYLIFRHNDPEVSFVEPPTGDELDLLLVVKAPYGDDPFDPDDPGTYSEKDIVCPDAPISGRDWPTVLHELIGDYGFGSRWALAATGDPAAPLTSLELFHRQQGETVPLLMQARGATLDRLLTSAASLVGERDLSDAATVWTVEGALARHEASFVLAPGFPSDPADKANADAIAAFDLSSPTYNDLAEADRIKYRDYVFDEAGEGHYDVADDEAVLEKGDLDDVLGEGEYAVRRRKPIGTLISTDDAGKPLRASLSISTDYEGDRAAPWDGTGTWQPIEGGWELLPDRIGIRVTAQNPNRWQIGQSREAGAPFPAGVVKGVELAAGTAPDFFLRLTCVVEADKALKGTAGLRTAAPLPDRVARVVDARDRYALHVVAARSEWNNEEDPVVVRDDGPDAQAEAEAIRATAEMGSMNAVVVIDHLTTAWKVGDRAHGITGRGLSFRTDGRAPDEAPQYPCVVSVRHELWPRQSTTLALSDAGGQLGNYRRAIAQGRARVRRGY